jgi:hypothetical protein
MKNSLLGTIVGKREVWEREWEKWGGSEKLISWYDRWKT